MMTTAKMKELFKSGAQDELLMDIYLDEAKLAYQRDRYVAAIEQFEKLYGAAEVSIYSAPGRSEIGGNHTDHQNGEVLAASVNLDAIAIVEATDDGFVKVVSDDYPMITVDVNDLEKKDEEEGTTLSLIKGVLAGIKDHGGKVGGFQAYITSDVLSGSGLSSSAAYEVLIGNILSGMYNDGKIDTITIAKIGQEAENIYFGKPCGLLDQMASSLGGFTFADFNDPQNPVVEKIDVEKQTSENNGRLILTVTYNVQEKMKAKKD